MGSTRTASAGPAPVEDDARGIVDPALMQRVARLTRYPPGEVLDGLVEWFWAVSWHLPPGREHVQRVLTLPGANLYVGVPEPGGDVSPEGCLQGVLRRMSARRLCGDGWTVAALTAPGGLGALVTVPARTLTDRTVPLGRPVLDVDHARLVASVVAAGDEEGRVAALRAGLDQVVLAADADRVAAARDVAAVARAAQTDRSVRRVEDLTAVAGVTERTLQRLFAEHAGVSPAWVVRRYRLLEAAEQARHHGEQVSWAALAADLGYSDQAHLVRDFKAHLGTTPAAYAARQPSPAA